MPETREVRRVPDKLLSADEVRQILGVSRVMISRLIARGHLQAVRIGRRTLIEPAELRRFIAASRSDGR